MSKRKAGKRPGLLFVRCPHPDCVHIGEVITKVHCRTKHGMERDELFEKYGEPQWAEGKKRKGRNE